MTDEQRDHVLADCLEAYHRQRARGETPDLDAFRERLGDLFEEFQELVAAETAIDCALEPPPPEPLPRTWGAYTLLAELGRGGAGVVYEAMHRKLGRKVALKVLKTGVDTDDNARERFQREATALAQVRHDHIVEIYEFGEVEGRPYYAMTLVEGPTLIELVKRDQRPEPEALCAGMAGIADALHSLHVAGIVHRDVKPSNIMLAPNGRYVLADFGLARTPLAETMTRSGDAIGTPLYMSPEQMLGKRDDIQAHSDIYGFGAALYQALTGKPPFRTDNMHALMRMVLSQRPDAPRTVAPDLPAGCSAIAMKCLEKEPGDRYPTAAALATDLRAFAAGERVTGKPLTRLQRGSRWVRSNPAWAAAALVVVALGVFFAVQPPSPASLQLRIVAPTVPAEMSVDAGPWVSVPVRGYALAPNERHEIVVRTSLGGFGELRVDVTPDAGDHFEWDRQLPVKDAGHPDYAAAWTADTAMIQPEGLSAPGTQRAVREEPDIEIHFPRGTVRREDLELWQVHVGEEFQDSGWIEFSVEGRLVDRVAFPQPEKFVTIGRIPAKVTEGLANGDDITWGFRSEQSGKLHKTAVFTVVEADLAKKLRTIDERLQGADRSLRPTMRPILRTTLFLNHNLALAAYREVQAAVAKGDDTLYLLLLEKKALEVMFPDRRERLRSTPYAKFQVRWSSRPVEELEDFEKALEARQTGG